MLQRILKLYVMAMAGDVRSPVPHLCGPPGCGKSTVVEQAAELLGVNLHVINVSRMSPLEVEGVQMPLPHDEEGMHLRMLTATFWTQLKEGDILLLDEFLRGFPEVYNALLDILTSRKVGKFTLPKVFIIAASNSVTAYDKALEDRLMHLPVPDPRKSKPERDRLAQLLVGTLGLLPSVAQSQEMTELMDDEVFPMFEILDQFKRGASSPGMLKGSSLRKLIGQVQLREVQAPSLKALLSANNARAMREGKPQYVVVTDPSTLNSSYEGAASSLPAHKLTPVQQLNLSLNMQLIKMFKVNQPSKETPDDADPFEPPF